MDTLFSENKNYQNKEHLPLAVKLRPQTLDEFQGQNEVLGKDSWLRAAILEDNIPSLILYGPPGCGKTTLAFIIRNYTKNRFIEINAIENGVSEVRQQISIAKENLSKFSKKTIVFIDEIHRFNRSQQDSLLNAVENNIIILIGATTENPYFEVNSALNSRCHILNFKSLDTSDIANIINNAITSKNGLNSKYKIEDGVIDYIALLSGGDVRSALNLLEVAARLSQNNKKDLKYKIIKENIQSAMPRNKILYDKNKDMHYDVISAFIKSMRGSDPDAAVYWMTRMLEGGEDPKFIARRIFICASEDIGNADPHAILVANAAFRAVEVIGMPECSINLSQAAIYMALAPKSNSAVEALFRAKNSIRHSSTKNVPDYLRDRHRPGSDTYGEYKYPHDYNNGWVDQKYLPNGLYCGDIYKSSNRGWEARRSEALDLIKNNKNIT